jgi:hypothetical protein
MPTAYRVHGGLFKDPNDFSTLVPGTEEEVGIYKTYGAAYKAWRGPAMGKIDIYSHRLLITPVEVGKDAYDKLPG